MILGPRITVCYKRFVRFRSSNASVVSKWLQNVLSPKRFAFCTSLVQIYMTVQDKKTETQKEKRDKITKDKITKKKTKKGLRRLLREFH